MGESVSYGNLDKRGGKSLRLVECVKVTHKKYREIDLQARDIFARHTTKPLPQRPATPLAESGSPSRAKRIDFVFEIRKREG